MVGILGRCLTAQTEGEQLQSAAMLLDEQLNLVLMEGADGYSSRFGNEGVCDDPFGRSVTSSISPQSAGSAVHREGDP